MTECNPSGWRATTPPNGTAYRSPVCHGTRRCAVVRRQRWIERAATLQWRVDWPPSCHHSHSASDRRSAYATGTHAACLRGLHSLLKRRTNVIIWPRLFGDIAQRSHPDVFFAQRLQRQFKIMMWQRDALRKHAGLNEPTMKTRRS